MRKVISWVLIIVGVLLVIGAVGLTGSNVKEDQDAGALAGDALVRVEAETPDVEEVLAGAAFRPDGEYKIPDFQLDPEKELPTVEVDGNLYVGTINIPAIDIELPVLNEWSYANLKISPCRMQGTPYTGQWIIIAHNYNTHFGLIKNLVIGDEVTFTDMDGNVFTYQVVDIETIDKYDTDGMMAGDWDLTVFTCTIGGASRVTVRCELVEDSQGGAG